MAPGVGEALDGAASFYYGAPHGLLGQLLDIARNSPEGQAGRPADALGVSAGTWNAWLMGARNPDAGRRPSPTNLARIRAASRGGRVRGKPSPTRATITAYVQWNGYYNPRAYRTVRLDGLGLGGMSTAWAAGAAPPTLSTEFDQAMRARYSGDRVNFHPDPPPGETATERGVRADLAP